MRQTDKQVAKSLLKVKHISGMPSLLKLESLNSCLQKVPMLCATKSQNCFMDMVNTYNSDQPKRASMFGATRVYLPNCIKCLTTCRYTMCRDNKLWPFSCQTYVTSAKADISPAWPTSAEVGWQTLLSHRFKTSWNLSAYLRSALLCFCRIAVPWRRHCASGSDFRRTSLLDNCFPPHEHDKGNLSSWWLQCVPLSWIYTTMLELQPKLLQPPWKVSIAFTTKSNVTQDI